MSPITPPMPFGIAKVSGAGKHPTTAAAAMEPSAHATNRAGKAVDFPASNKGKAPGYDRQHSQHAGKTKRLHDDVGKGSAGIAEDIVGGLPGGIGIARIQHVPRCERRNGKRQHQEQGKACKTRDLPQYECREREADGTTVQCRRIASAHSAQPVSCKYRDESTTCRPPDESAPPNQTRVNAY